MTTRRWLFADQLGPQFLDQPDQPALLIESRAVLRRRRFHRGKAHLLLSGLRHRARELGDQAVFLQADTYDDALRELSDRGCDEPLSAVQPTSYAADRFVRSRGIEMVSEGRGYVTTREDFARWAGSRGRRRLLLEDFYRWQRVRFGVLMDGDQPVGGQWTSITTTVLGAAVGPVPDAAVYARISSDPNETALGVTRQLQDCLALAKTKGWPVVETYVENDVSATSGKMRPQYTRMMQELSTGRIGALVVWDVDRLTRSPRELEDVIDLAEKCGVALASVGGEIDLADPQGRLTARIKGSVAKHEIEQLTRRIKRKIAERAEAGAPHGREAYGWRREQVYDEQGRRIGSRDVLDPEQAEVVRKAAQAILTGESVRGLANSLNAAGSVSLNGKPWSNITLRRVLLRDRNAGLRVHQGKVVGKGDWEPLYDEDTHRRVVAILTAPGRRVGPPTSAIKYLLSGLALCGVCGQPLRVLLAGKDRTSDSYICKNGYHVRRQMQPLDDLVTKVVVGRLTQPDAADLFHRDDDEDGRQAREQADAMRARLDLAADAYADGEIDGAQLKRITSKLRPQLERLEKLERAASTSPDLSDLAGPDIAGRWDSLPLARKRAVIDALVSVAVHLSTARGGAAASFDPKSIEIVWRTA